MVSIELSTKQSRDAVLFCLAFTIIHVIFCNDWQWWQIIFRFFWITFISGLVQFSLLSTILKSLGIVRLLLTIFTFGTITTLKIIFFIHQDVETYIVENQDTQKYNFIVDILMIDIQCSYMLTVCSVLWYYVGLAKHFGYLNEWKFVLRSLIPHSLILFVVSVCPSSTLQNWWISLRLYALIIGIIELIFDQGFSPFFRTKRGEIGIRHSSLNPNDISCIISTKVKLMLNILSLARHLYFMAFISSWLFAILLMNNMYSMTRKLLLRGSQHLQMNVVL